MDGPTARIDDRPPEGNGRRYLAALGAGLAAGSAGWSRARPVGRASVTLPARVEAGGRHVVAGLHPDGRTHESHFDDSEDPGAAVDQADFASGNWNADERPIE